MGKRDRIVYKDKDIKKEIPTDQERKEAYVPGKKERILMVFMRVIMGILKIIERRIGRVRARRLAKRMDSKR